MRKRNSYRKSNGSFTILNDVTLGWGKLHKCSYGRSFYLNLLVLLFEAKPELNLNLDYNEYANTLPQQK